MNEPIINFFVRKILKLNLGPIDSSLTNNNITITFTDDDCMYINNITGAQSKITDVIIKDKYDDLIVTDMSEEKIYIVRTGGIYIKSGVDVINLLKPLTDANAKNSDDIIQLNKDIDFLLSNINDMRKKDIDKDYRVNLPLANITPGLVDPIISAKSFVFDETIKLVSLNKIIFDIYQNDLTVGETPSLNINIEVYDDTKLLVKTIPIDLTTTIIDIALTDQIKLKSGYIKVNVINVSGLEKTFRAAILLQLYKETILEDLTFPETILNTI